MKIKSEANSGGRIFMMSSLHKEIGTVELHHYTTKDWFVLELSSARAEKKITSSASISQTDSVLTGVLGPEYD